MSHATPRGALRRRGCAGLALAALALALGPASAQSPAAMPAQERQRIETLLRAIEADTALRFDRNGTQANGKVAVRFLRAKWARNEAGVLTAEAFIDQIASASSTTGRPYRVCVKPNDCTEAGPWLKGLLRRLEGQAR